MTTDAGIDTEPVLSRLADIANELQEALLASDLQRLLQRIQEGRSFVACIGQFKRGKSTLLNALVGEAILPAGVVPVTTVPTVLRYGGTRQARVLIKNKWQSIPTTSLPQYVSEELNPENGKRVEGVEVFLPAPILASGMCLVDTPGIGSVFAGNTETTKQFIPQVDAAILVIGADPPISGEELALTEAVCANVDHFVVVLNKVDRVSQDERRAASDFARRVLQDRLQQPVAAIYQVSALAQLEHAGDGGDWSQLVGDLGCLATTSNRAMTRAAGERGINRFSAALRRSVDERLRALQEPIADSEQRIVNLRQTAGLAEHALRDLGPLFAAEQNRLSITLLARRKDFLRSTLPIALDELKRESRAIPARFGPARRKELMALAQTIARHRVMPWLDSEQNHAQKLYGEVADRFIEMRNDLLRRICEQQVGDGSQLLGSLDDEQGFRIRSRFFFHEMTTVAQPASPLRYALDALLGAFRLDRMLRAEAAEFLEKLLTTNTSRVQADVERRVVESRLQLESEVRKLIRQVIDSAEQSLTSACEKLKAGSEAVHQEIVRLRDMREELSALRVRK